VIKRGSTAQRRYGAAQAVLWLEATLVLAR
jgi:hypothetical protein